MTTISNSSGPDEFSGTGTSAPSSRAISMQQLLDDDGVWPRPGWMVLNSARDSEFTGEVVLDSELEVRVFLDRGSVYAAERLDDAPIEERLVAAQALSRDDLERGAIRVGDTTNLSHLFERVPAVDRELVMIMTEVMTNETLSWIGSRKVRGVETTAYRYHPSGLHHWFDVPADEPAAAPPVSVPSHAPHTAAFPPPRAVDRVTAFAVPPAAEPIVLATVRARGTDDAVHPGGRSTPVGQHGGVPDVAAGLGVSIEWAEPSSLRIGNEADQLVERQRPGRSDGRAHASDSRTSGFSFTLPPTRLTTEAPHATSVEVSDDVVMAVRRAVESIAHGRAAGGSSTSALHTTQSATVAALTPTSAQPTFQPPTFHPPTLAPPTAAPAPVQHTSEAAPELHVEESLEPYPAELGGDDPAAQQPDFELASPAAEREARPGALRRLIGSLRRR